MLSTTPCGIGTQKDTQQACSVVGASVRTAGGALRICNGKSAKHAGKRQRLVVCRLVLHIGVLHVRSSVANAVVMCLFS
jgi:hypothetical protein